MDYREAFRIGPDSKLNLDMLDPGFMDHGPSGLAKDEADRWRRKLSGQQALLYAEKEALGAGRPSGNGCGWQGRHHQPRVFRAQPAGHDGDMLQTANPNRDVA